MSKALGSEIKKFWNSDLPEHWEHECDYDLGFEEFDELSDTAKYELNDLGFFVVAHDKEISFNKAFKDWKKQQTHTQVLIAIPKELETAIKTYLEKMNVEIL